MKLLERFEIQKEGIYKESEPTESPLGQTSNFFCTNDNKLSIIPLVRKYI